MLRSFSFGLPCFFEGNFWLVENRWSTGVIQGRDVTLRENINVPYISKLCFP